MGLARSSHLERACRGAVQPRVDELRIASPVTTDARASLGWVELSRYVRRVLRRVMRGRRRHENDLPDLEQEVMLQILNSRHTYRGESTFLTWNTVSPSRRRRVRAPAAP